MSNNKSAEMQDWRLNQLEKNIVSTIYTVDTNLTRKIVGEGKDFETLHDAVEWLGNVKQTGGIIYIGIDDGVHTLDLDMHRDTLYIGNTTLVHSAGAHIFSKNVIFYSTSGNEDDCTITTDRSTLPDFMFLFSPFMIRQSSVIFSRITFDAVIGGYNIAVDGGTSGIMAGAIYGDNSSVNFLNCNINNQGVGATMSGGGLGLFETTVSTNLYGVSAGFSKVRIENSTIEQSMVAGITGTGAGQMDINSQITLRNTTFSSNTANTDIPLNEIQRDGTFISDGTAALTFA